MCAAAGVARGIGAVEPVDVGKEQQQVGPDHLGDARREPVIVAVAQFVGGDAVILVDHRQRALGEQHGDGGAGVQPAAAALGILEGEQELRGRDAVRREGGFPGLHQQNLAGGGRGLLVVEPRRALQAEMPPAERDRAGGDDHHLLARLAQRRDVVREPGQPGRTHAARMLDQQGRADLHDHAPRVGEQSRGAHRTPCRVAAGMAATAGPEAPNIGQE